MKRIDRPRNVCYLKNFFFMYIVFVKDNFGHVGPNDNGVP